MMSLRKCQDFHIYGYEIHKELKSTVNQKAIFQEAYRKFFNVIKIPQRIHNFFDILSTCFLYQQFSSELFTMAVLLKHAPLEMFMFSVVLSVFYLPQKKAFKYL